MTMMTTHPDATFERESHVRECYVALARLEMLLPEYRKVAPPQRTRAAEVEVEHLRRLLDDPSLSCKDARGAANRARRHVRRLDRAVRERPGPWSPVERVAGA